MATHKYDKTPVVVAIGQSHTVELPPRVLRVRLTGLLFESDKAFLLPGAMRGIRGLIDLYDEHPEMEMVITGHTDRVGDGAYNKGLSKERARAVGHYLKDEVDGWLVWYGKQPYSAAWGVREDQHMLSAVHDTATGAPFYEGPIHGQLDPVTQDAVKRFQRSRTLTDDGFPGPDTRRALVTAYMELDGTTLPASITPAQLGCGENHNEKPTADGVDEPANRRVEIFLFDGGPVDPPVPADCPGAGCPYETWRQQAKQTFDFDHDVGELHVVVVRDIAPDRQPPVEGARVTIRGPADRSGTTDDQGAVHFANVKPGVYAITVEKDGFIEARDEVEVRPGGMASDSPKQQTTSHSFAGDGDGEPGTDDTGTPVKKIPIRPDEAIRLVATGERIAPHREGAPLAGVELQLMMRSQNGPPGSGIDFRNPYKPEPPIVTERTPGDAPDQTQPWHGTVVTQVAPDDKLELRVDTKGYRDTWVPFDVPKDADKNNPPRVVVALEPDVAYSKVTPLSAYGEALATTESDRRQRICKLALAEAKRWEDAWDRVYAESGVGAMGNKPSWPFVHDYFRIILDKSDMTRSEDEPLTILWPYRASKGAIDQWKPVHRAWEKENPKTRGDEPPEPVTSWCGIFATWVVRTAADAALYWVANGGPHRGPPASKTRLAIEKDRDVAVPVGSIIKVAEKDPAKPVQHHALVVGNDGGYSFNGDTYDLKTVEGNFSEPQAGTEAGNPKLDHNARPAVQVWYRKRKEVDFFYRWPLV